VYEQRIRKALLSVGNVPYHITCLTTLGTSKLILEDTMTNVYCFSFVDFPSFFFPHKVLKRRFFFEKKTQKTTEKIPPQNTTKI